jgi:hypothetical protein
MSADQNPEDPAVTRAFAASVGALVVGPLIAGGGIASVANATMTDINAIAGGWAAIIIGATLASIGTVAAYDHAVMMRRNNQHHETAMAETRRHHQTVMAEQQRHHEAVMKELAGISGAMLQSDNEMDRHRHHG